MANLMLIWWLVAVGLMVFGAVLVLNPATD